MNSRCRSSCLCDVSTSSTFDFLRRRSSVIILTLYHLIKGAWFLFLIFYPCIIHDLVIVPEYICWPLATESHIVTCEVMSLWSLYYHTVHVRLELWRIPRVAGYISDDTVQELDATTDLLDTPTRSTATCTIWSAIGHHMRSYVLGSLIDNDWGAIRKYIIIAIQQGSPGQQPHERVTGRRGAPAMITSLESWFLPLQGLIRTWTWTWT